MQDWLVSLALAGVLVGCVDDERSAHDAALATTTADASDPGDDASEGTTLATRDAGHEGNAEEYEPHILNVGAPCSSDADCLGLKAICLQVVAIPGVVTLTYAGGYCSATCSVNEDCGPGGVCPSAMLANVPSVAEFSHCTRTCDRTNHACRDGYVCGDLSRIGPAKIDSCVPYVEDVSSGTTRAELDGGTRSGPSDASRIDAGTLPGLLSHPRNERADP